MTMLICELLEAADLIMQELPNFPWKGAVNADGVMSENCHTLSFRKVTAWQRDAL